MARPDRDDLPTKLRIAPGKACRLRDPDAARVFGWERAAAEAVTADNLRRLGELQFKMYADGRHSLLVVLQAIDGGIDGGTVAPQQHRFHGGVIAEAEAEDAAAPGHGSRTVGADGMGVTVGVTGGLLQHNGLPLAAAVVQREREAGFEQIGGHGGPEGPQTDEADGVAADGGRIRPHPGQPRRAAPCLRAARGWRRHRWRCATSGRPDRPSPQRPRNRRRR